jgi:hypothetical protein
MMAFLCIGKCCFQVGNITVDSKYRDVFFDFTFGFSDDVEADDK